jgi:DnaK suppressor protein
MTKRQTQKIRQRLQEKLTDITGNGALRQELVTEWSSDPMDQVQARQDLDLTVHTIDSTYKTRKAIETAIELLESGEYGICLDCGENINPKRLEAIPWTTLCVSCQEEHDHAASENPEGSSFKRAA